MRSKAGFDGVELQGANSHLIEQFLEDGTTKRTDNYGGSEENRARLLLDIIEEVSAAIGSDRLGVRLSPFGQYGGIHDSNPRELFGFVIKELSKRHIAYLHLIEARGSEMGLTDELHENAAKATFAKSSADATITSSFFITFQSLFFLFRSLSKLPFRWHAEHRHARDQHTQNIGQ